MGGEFTAKVAQILEKSEQRDKIDSLKQVASQLATPDGATDICELLTLLANDSVQLVVSRPVLVHIADLMTSAADELGLESIKSVAAHGIDAIKERRVAFDEVDAKFREAQGAALVDSESYLEAARVLSGINLESGRYSDSDKAKQVRFCPLYWSVL